MTDEPERVFINDQRVLAEGGATFARHHSGGSRSRR